MSEDQTLVRCMEVITEISGYFLSASNGLINVPKINMSSPIVLSLHLTRKKRSYCRKQRRVLWLFLREQKAGAAGHAGGVILAVKL